MSAAGLAVPAVLQPDGPVAERGAPSQPERRHHRSSEPATSTTRQARTARSASSRCPLTASPSLSRRQNVVRSARAKQASGIVRHSAGPPPRERVMPCSWSLGAIWLGCLGRGLHLFHGSERPAPVPVLPHAACFSAADGTDERSHRCRRVGGRRGARVRQVRAACAAGCSRWWILRPRTTRPAQLGCRCQGRRARAGALALVQFQFRLFAAEPALGLGDLHAFPGTEPDRVCFELGDHRQHVEQQLADRVCRVMDGRQG